MSIATDVRAYADTALEQGKTVLTQAGAAVTQANKRLVTDGPKPAYAALGAADLFASTVTKLPSTVTKLPGTVTKLPADAAQNVSKVQQSGLALLSKTAEDAQARFAELRSRLDAGRDAVTALPDAAKGKGESYLASAQSASEGYLGLARNLFDTLTSRGEAKAAELRKDPRLTKLLGELTEAGETAQAKVSPTVGKVRSQVEPLVKSAFDAVQASDLVESAAAKTMAARSAAVSRSTRKPAVASKPAVAAPAKKTPAAKKAAPTKTVRKSTAATKPAVTKKATPAKAARKVTAAKPADRG